jgi:NADH-quinone oxidoreductase subunit M
MDRLGGLWADVPRMSGIALVFALASLGLPGLGNFVGEFTVLLGTYQTYPSIAVPAAAGLVFAAIYGLRIMQRVFFGPLTIESRIPDASVRESALMAALVAVIVWLGVYPQPVFNLTVRSVGAVVRSASGEGHGLKVRTKNGEQARGAFLSLPGNRR